MVKFYKGPPEGPPEGSPEGPPERLRSTKENPGFEKFEEVQCIQLSHNN